MRYVYLGLSLLSLGIGSILMTNTILGYALVALSVIVALAGIAEVSKDKRANTKPN